MSHRLVVGVDGSAASTAAAEWAAYQAHRSGRALRLIHVRATDGTAPAAPAATAELLPQSVRVIRSHLAAALPELEISCEDVPGSPAYALVAAGEREGLLVLGSHGSGGLAGSLVGSVALRAAAHAGCPVILVKAGAEGGGGTLGEVVAGVEAGRPPAEVLAFAFEQAVSRGAVLRAVGSRTPPAGPYRTEAPVDQPQIRDSLAAAQSLRLDDALTPWREKFPGVRVTVEVTGRPAGQALVEASRGAALVVMGRRTPRIRPVAPRLGRVAHEVLHHAQSPVAVVPHD